MLNRGSLKDAGVYLVLLVTLLALSSGAHLMYGRWSDGLAGLFGDPWDQYNARIVAAGRIYRSLKANGRDLGPFGQDLGELTDEERRDLEKARRDMVAQGLHLLEQIPSRSLISLRQGTYTSVPSFFLVGFLGVLVGRYRKLFMIPLLGAAAWVSVFVAFLSFRTPSGTSVWHQSIPELTLSLGGWVMATTIALLVGCYSGRATLRAFRQVSSAQQVVRPIDPFLNLIAWRAVTVCMLVTSTILLAFNYCVLLSSPPSVQDMPTHMWMNQTARSPEVSQDARSNDDSPQLLEDARRTLVAHEEQTAGKFKEILEVLRECRMP